MTLKEGGRVRLVEDLALDGAVSLAGDSPAGTGAVVGRLSLGAGCEGTVERLDDHQDLHQSQAVREYLRLKSLLDDYGSQMPPASRKQLEEQVGALEAAWTAHQEQGLHMTVRVRFDNGFVLDGARTTLFTSA
ncbi:hypothetical protein [Streptomyces sp. NPDC012888]|uniref:hypothetical protein n=1 Tax=Streptomyces sp. NPDC012888 TaxID=3364855 RepID=UPI003684615B